MLLVINDVDICVLWNWLNFVYLFIIFIGDISVDIEIFVDFRILYFLSLYFVGEIISSCFFNIG